jgi:hypothetical protein
MEHTKEIEHLAKLIAFWHGQKISYRHPRDGNLTVAAVRTGDHSGFPHVTNRYMHSHWQEYVAAAEQVIVYFSAARTDDPEPKEIEAGLRAWYPSGVWDQTVKDGDPLVAKERRDMRRVINAVDRVREANASQTADTKPLEESD